jgi:hypothetical protein
MVGEGYESRGHRRTRRQRRLFSGLGGESVTLLREAAVQCGLAGAAFGA